MPEIHVPCEFQAYVSIPSKKERSALAVAFLEVALVLAILSIEFVVLALHSLLESWLSSLCLKRGGLAC